MPKHILRILICGYACILCAAAALVFALPTLGISANRYSFACIACAGAFGLMAVLGGHLKRDFRLWQGLALLLVGVFASIGHIYVSIAIGHLFHKHRVAWSIGAYIGINILQSVLMSVFFQIMNRFYWHWMNRLFENIAPA